MKRIHNSAVGPRYVAINEPVRTYAPGSPERVELERELDRQGSRVVDIPLVIGGKSEMTTTRSDVRAPHDHAHVLATLSYANGADAQRAVDAAMAAHGDWSRWSLQERAAVFRIQGRKDRSEIVRGEHEAKAVLAVREPGQDAIALSHAFSSASPRTTTN